MTLPVQHYLTRQVPRYTSYPSALRFHEGVGADAFASALGRVGVYDAVSFYVHIPYCQQLCYYCGCNMQVENQLDRALPYVDGLLKEIGLVADQLGGHGQTTQIHFGGGTPNYFSAAQLSRIIEAIEQRCGLVDGTPVAMEIDPRFIDRAEVEALTAAGVTRFSLGIQDFDLEVQRKINRVQPYELVEKCVSDIRQAGISDLSFDLLYGLPGQRVDGFRRTLERTICLAPDRISLFGYAHLPARLAHQRLIDDDDLPDLAARAALATLAAEQLVQAGYLAIGFDHFAKPHTAIAQAMLSDRLNRNFQGFTEDPADVVIGFGSSAISQIDGTYFQNAKRTPAYLESIRRGTLATARGVAATPEERLIGQLIRDVLCRGEVRLSPYFAAIDPDDGRYRARSLAALEPLAKDGLVQIDADRLSIPANARLYARIVAAALDPAMTSPPPRLSPAI